MAKIQITNANDGAAAAVQQREGEETALVVATRDAVQRENRSGFFINETHGINLNIDASVGGTPLLVHDGTDTAAFTGSNIIGSSVTFADGLPANGGLDAVGVTAPSVNDVWEFDKTTTMNVGAFVSLTMFVYVVGAYAPGDVVELYLWDSAAALQIGDAIDISDYFNSGDVGVWQPLNIPTTDFGVGATSTVVDGIRMRYANKSGAAVRFRMDDIQFEESGVPVRFFVKPEREEWLYINSFTISMRATQSGILANAGAPMLDPDTFLGQSLSTFIVYARENNQGNVFTFPFNKVMDMLQFGGLNLHYGTNNDGTVLWLSQTSEVAEPLLLRPDYGDCLSYTISEDFSVLFTHFRIAYTGWVEKRLLQR